MQEINLNQDMTVVLDDEDFANLSQYHWCYRGEPNSDLGYAMRHARIDGKNKTVYMHREIMNPPPGHDVIFKNHDRLDCRRANLCVVTKKEARRHNRVRRDSKTGIKGVRFSPSSYTWSAYIFRDGICCKIGTYDSREEAVKAYEDEVMKENAHLFNGPPVVEQHADMVERLTPDYPNW